MGIGIAAEKKNTQIRSLRLDAGHGAVWAFLNLRLGLTWRRPSYSLSLAMDAIKVQNFVLGSLLLKNHREVKKKFVLKHVCVTLTLQ